MSEQPINNPDNVVNISTSVPDSGKAVVYAEAPERTGVETSTYSCIYGFSQKVDDGTILPAYGSSNDRNNAAFRGSGNSVESAYSDIGEPIGEDPAWHVEGTEQDESKVRTALGQQYDLEGLKDRYSDEDWNSLANANTLQAYLENRYNNMQNNNEISTGQNTLDIWKHYPEQQTRDSRRRDPWTYLCDDDTDISC